MENDREVDGLTVKKRGMVATVLAHLAAEYIASVMVEGNSYVK